MQKDALRFLEINNKKNKNKFFEHNLMIIASYIENEGNYNKIIKDIKWTDKLEKLQGKT